MYNINEVPSPDESHFVGAVFPFQEEGYHYFMTVRDRNLMRDRINIKFPGGSNEDWYEDDFTYEDELFKTLDRIGFRDQKVQAKVYQTYKKRIKNYGQPEKNSAMLVVLRTLTMECLRNVGYFPLDIEPTVVEYTEKQGHTQYFIEVKELMDANGNVVEKPDSTTKFKALDSDVVESRLPLIVGEYERMIHAHKNAAKKYLMWKVKNGEYTIEETFGKPEEEQEDADAE